MADRAKVTSGWVLAAGPRAASGPAGSHGVVLGVEAAAPTADEAPIPVPARGGPLTWRIGRRRARTVPTTKTSMSRRRTQGPPRSFKTAMAGREAAKAVSDARRPSCALAVASRL